MLVVLVHAVEDEQVEQVVLIFVRLDVQLGVVVEEVVKGVALVGARGKRQGELAIVAARSVRHGPVRLVLLLGPMPRASGKWCRWRPKKDAGGGLLHESLALGAFDKELEHLPVQPPHNRYVQHVLAYVRLLLCAHQQHVCSSMRAAVRPQSHNCHLVSRMWQRGLLSEG
jgi:hypothetical protein